MSSPKPLVSSVSVLSASNAANKLKPRSKPKPLAGDPPTSTTEKENQDPQSSEDSERGRPSACVFVASLCSTTADDDLCVSVTNLFEKWGKITRVKVLRDTRNRPYAFVQYTNDKDAAAAIKEAQGAFLDSRKIRCEPAKVNRTLFLLLPRPIANDDITKSLGEFGPIERLVSSIYFTNPEKSPSPFSKGWYCQFVYRDDAITAFASLSESDKFSIEWAQNIDTLKAAQLGDSIKPKFDRCAIFIGQLSSDTTEKELRERFKPHGEIESLSIINNRDFNTFAFLRYTTERSAAKAVEAENHSLFKRRTMHVQFREFGSTKKFNYSANGVALAPPPIRFGRKLATVRERTPANHLQRDGGRNFERGQGDGRGPERVNEHRRLDRRSDGGHRANESRYEGRYEGRSEADRNPGRGHENQRWNRAPREYGSYAPPYSSEPYAQVTPNKYGPLSPEAQRFNRRLNGSYPNDMDSRNPAPTTPFYYYVPDTLYYGGYPYYLPGMYSQDEQKGKEV